MSDDKQTTGAWDPYDVWLKRVKQPRDETLRQRKLDQQESEPAASTPAEEAAVNPDPRPSAA